MNKLTAKIAVWHGVVAVLAWWMWNVGQRVGFNSVTGVDIQLPSLGAFLLLTATVVLGYIVFQEKRWASSISAILGLSFLMAFGWSKLNLMAALILWAFNFWSASMAKQEISERRILNIQVALYHALLPIVLGLFVMISFVAYRSPVLSEIKTSQQLPSQSQMFFQQIIESTVGQKINASTPQERNLLINEIASQTLQEINSVLKPYFRYAPPILAFGLFLILWGLSFIFIWLSVLVGLILFWILKKTHVVRVEEVDVKAQILIV